MGIANPENATTLATGQVLATHALRDDLMAVLFPRGGVLPSELLQSRVKLKLQVLTSGLEMALLDTGVQQLRSWDLLSESGLLREPALIDFALSRIAEDRLRHNIQIASESSLLAQLPVALLGHKNDRLSEMARRLLHAEQISVFDDGLLYRRLGNETLHMLCWRVVAALLECNAAQKGALTAAAQALLSAQDEAVNPSAIARKLVFFLGQEYRAELVDPGKAGLQLFVASLDQEYGLGSDFLLRVIGGDDGAPLLLLLKGQNLTVDAATGIMSVLHPNGGDLATLEWQRCYQTIDTVDARAAIGSWTDGLAE